VTVLLAPVSQSSFTCAAASGLLAPVAVAHGLALPWEQFKAVGHSVCYQYINNMTHHTVCTGFQHLCCTSVTRAEGRSLAGSAGAGLQLIQCCSAQQQCHSCMHGFSCIPCCTPLVSTLGQQQVLQLHTAVQWPLRQGWTCHGPMVHHAGL
jgi:hypothetical protein